MAQSNDPQKLSAREWLAVVAGAALLLASVVVGVALPPLDTLPLWAGRGLGAVAILGLLLVTTVSVRALLRTDTEGVERQEAERASMVTVLVVVVAGFSYALLEAFAGLPRMTAAAPATAAGLVWVIAFAWQRPGGEEG